MHADIALLIKVIERLVDRLDEQERKQMADLAALQASVANLKTQVDALEAAQAAKPPSVPQADLDPVVNDINTEAARVQQLAAAP